MVMHTCTVGPPTCHCRRPWLQPPSRRLPRYSHCAFILLFAQFCPLPSASSAFDELYSSKLHERFCSKCSCKPVSGSSDWFKVRIGRIFQIIFMSTSGRWHVISTAVLLGAHLARMHSLTWSMSFPMRVSRTGSAGRCASFLDLAPKRSQHWPGLQQIECLRLGSDSECRESDGRRLNVRDSESKAWRPASDRSRRRLSRCVLPTLPCMIHHFSSTPPPPPPYPPPIYPAPSFEPNPASVVVP